MDIIYANEHLADMLSLLEELGEKEILIVYTHHEKEHQVPQSKLNIKTAFLIKNSKEVQTYAKHYDALIGLATRDLIESKQVNYLFGAETLSDKDKTHFRAGGLNQVLAKLIADKGKTYLFDLDSVLRSDRHELIIGRMSFNKRLLSKYSAQMECVSMAQAPLGLRAPKERKLFLEKL